MCDEIEKARMEVENFVDFGIVNLTLWSPETTQIMYWVPWLGNWSMHGRRVLHVCAHVYPI